MDSDDLYHEYIIASTESHLLPKFLDPVPVTAVSSALIVGKLVNINRQMCKRRLIFRYLFLSHII